jgi:hypothetical protein
MAERTSHEPGTPSWVDLGSPDPSASAEFYGRLFGWEIEDAGPESGGYRMCTLRGRSVAGLGPQQTPDQPPWWTTYVSVADADMTAKKVEAAGGNVLVAPMDVMDAGRMAVFTDAEGAVFSVWQPQAHIGAEIVNEHGSLTWNELNSRDRDKAKAFYSSVFGWEPAEFQGDYVVFNLDDSGIAGLMGMGEAFPAEVPPHWTVYFAVDDCDAAAARIAELGGTVVAEPFDIENVGRIAIVQGPHGESFGVITNAQPG